GGAIYDAPGTTVTVINSIFGNNSGGASANLWGAIYQASGSPTITGAQFLGGPGFAAGGAIYMAGGNVSMVNTVISGATADLGGAVYQAAGNLSMVNCNVQLGGARLGGGIYQAGGVLSATKCTFTSDEAVSFDSTAAD